MWTNRSRYTAIAAAILVVACGGGGGGDGPLPPELVKITMANQDGVAHAAVGSLVPFINVPMLTISPSPGRVTTATPHGTKHGVGLNDLVRRPFTLAAKPMTADVVRAMTRYVGTERCAVSGTIAVTWEDNDENRVLSAGDSVSAAFEQCSDWPGSSVNGGLGMSLTTVSITPALQDIGGSISFQSLVMLDEGTGMTLNGGLGFRLTDALQAKGVDSLGTYTVDSTGLKAVVTGGFGDTFEYRAGYRMTYRDFTPSMAGIVATEEITANGRFGSATLGGDLDLTTPLPFKASYISTEGDDVFPTEGQMIATGLDSTRISLTATDSPQVRMDVCDDGDGVWEATKMVDWDWLIP